MNYLLEVFELLVSGEALLLGLSAVDGDGREVLLCQQLGQGDAPLHRPENEGYVKLGHRQIRHQGNYLKLG